MSGGVICYKSELHILGSMHAVASQNWTSFVRCLLHLGQFCLADQVSLINTHCLGQTDHPSGLISYTVLYQSVWRIL
uniref:Uncharacterized protein n=1 Tax=Anguilla anguilla TaxID=7936 RepID=A0A0E9TDF6_ANGAN